MDMDKLQSVIDNHECQMKNSMALVHSLSWNFAIKYVVTQLKNSLLADESVHEEVKRYLKEGSVTQLDFYFQKRIDTYVTHFAYTEGHPSLKEYGQIRFKAQESLRQVGFCTAEINLYEMIAYLTHESFRIDIRQSVESILVNDRKHRHLQVISAMCHKYGHVSGVDFLTVVQQCMAVYQKHNDARKLALAEQRQFMVKKKTWWEKLTGEV